MCAAVYVLSTVTGYVLTSALLLKCPTLVHRKKREQFLSRHISHRGGECQSVGPLVRGGASCAQQPLVWLPVELCIKQSKENMIQTNLRLSLKTSRNGTPAAEVHSGKCKKVQVLKCHRRSKVTMSTWIIWGSFATLTTLVLFYFIFIYLWDIMGCSTSCFFFLSDERVLTFDQINSSNSAITDK